MNPPNEDLKPKDNMESLKQETAACGPGCGCHASGASSKMRCVLGAIVLVAAGVMVARAVIKSNGASTATPTAGFTTTALTEQPAAPVPAASDTVAVKEIGALSELNVVATNTDAVFVFVPGKSDATAQAPMSQIRDAIRKIESQASKKVGIFSLKTGSPDYEKVVAQLSMPGVLALVKGHGMSAVSGEITEMKLVQAYLKASSAGGCCGGGSTSCK